MQKKIERYITIMFAVFMVWLGAMALTLMAEQYLIAGLLTALLVTVYRCLDAKVRALEIREKIKENFKRQMRELEE